MAKKKAKPAKKAAPKKSAKPAKKAASKPAKKAVAKAKPAKKVAKPAKKAAPKSAPKKTTSPAKKATAFAAPARTPAKPKSTANLTALFSPLDDRIVVEEIGASDRTPGGLYIPDTAAESDRPRQGKVLAVGRGHREKTGRLRPLDVQLGDIVLFEKYSGSTISIVDSDYMLLRESNVLGILSSRKNG